MFKLFKSFDDGATVFTSQTFEDAAEYAKVTVENDPEATPVLVFYQTHSMLLNGQRKLAGIVQKGKIFEMMFRPFLYLEVHVVTVFGHKNTHICHEPSLIATCLKLRSFNNKITSIKPVVRRKFYQKLSKPLPF